MKTVRLPLIRPYLGKRANDWIKEVFNSGWLTQAKFVDALEEKIRAYSNVKYALLLNSATSGLIAAIKSLDLKETDEVITPSFTFPATSNAVILGGAKPVFCDINLETFNIAIDKIEEVITKNTKAIIPVHEFGLAADMENILRIAKRHKLFVIEDAACSLGAKYKEKNAGALGDVGVFSFHPRKIITSGEGGCVVTNSYKIAKKIECLRNHGEYRKQFIHYGYNFRLSDIQGAVLLSQFEEIKDIIARRIDLSLRYNKLLASLEDRRFLKRPVCPSGYKHIYQSYVVLLSRRINRDKLKDILRQKGIETQFGTYCVPMLDFYRKNFSTPTEYWENAYYAYKHTLALPLYHTLKLSEQEYIVEHLTRVIKNVWNRRDN